MNGLDLFSGIGGISLALSGFVRTVAYCERERYAQGVLLSRMRSGELDCAPIWDDVCTLRADMLPRIDIITGGFPCQDISVAGRGAGLDGKRSGLFFEICRLASECRPRFIFLENVPAIAVRGLDRVCLELHALGYDCRWTTISAGSVGAPHRRERWFLLAHARRITQGATENIRSDKLKTIKSDASDVCFSISRTEYLSRRSKKGLSNKSKWPAEPNISRVAYGIPNRIHRVKCLGNGVVSLQVLTAFHKLLQV